VICIYCAIGQRASSIAKVIAKLTENKAMEYSIVIATEGNNVPGLLYIALTPLQVLQNILWNRT